MNERILEQSAMKCLIDNFGIVEAERFISIIIRNPFNYTEWQRGLYDNMTVEELFKKASSLRQSK